MDEAINREAKIRAAALEEHAQLTELALRSKSHWGYDPEFLSDCRASLTLTPQYVATHPVYVLEEENCIVGFYSLIETTNEVVDLEHLFIEPSAIGKGYGKQLWQHLVTTARRLGYRLMTIEADPFAEPFYRRMGAAQVGEVPSEVRTGRMLPLLHFHLTDSK
jgi:GNAT superfamily N-acetyltransferase